MDDKIDEQIIIRMDDKIEDLRNEVKAKHDDPEVEMLMWGVFMKE